MVERFVFSHLRLLGHVVEPGIIGFRVDQFHHITIYYAIWHYILVYVKLYKGFCILDYSILL